MSAKQDFENMLRYSTKTASVGPEELITMGKRASRMHLDYDVPLTEAVIKIASEQPGLTKDHLQRVVENANLLTFESMFKVASDKNITFDLADPEDVVSGVLGPRDMEEDLSAYANPPSLPEISGMFDLEKKLASYTDVPVDVALTRLHHQTKYGGEYLESELSAIDNHAENAVAKLASLATQAVREGSSIVEVLELMAEAASDIQSFEKISSIVGRDLRGFSNNIGSPSNGLPNTEHPIYEQYKLAEELVKKASQIKLASECLAQEADRLRDARIRLHTSK